MINEIICIGTSFTEGGGLNPKNRFGESDPAVTWYKENKGIEISSMKDVSWPNQLQKISKVKTRNLGKCGASIEYLMRNVEEIIETEDCLNKYFILEYSSWGRSELWSSKHNQWIVTNWGPRDGQDPTTEGYAVMMTTDYNFGTQLEPHEFTIYETFLDNYFNELEYLIQRDRQFMNLLYKLKAKKIDFEILLLEPTYWIGFDTDSLFKKRCILKENLWAYIAEKKLSIQDVTNGFVMDGHPSIEGHEHIAKLIYEKLKENNIFENKTEGIYEKIRTIYRKMAKLA